MGIQEIQYGIAEEEEQEVSTQKEQIQAEYEREMSFLRLSENPNIQKWIEKFVVDPLRKLEVAHDVSTDTNPSFILKGQVFRLKKLRDWVEIHTRRCNTLKKKIEELRKGN